MSLNTDKRKIRYCFCCKNCFNNNKTYPYSQLRKVLIDWNFETEGGFTNYMMKDHKLELQFYCIEHYNSGDPIQPNNLWHFSIGGSYCKSCDVYIVRDGKKREKEHVYMRS